MNHMRDLGALVVTTDMLTKEVWEHLRWALNHAQPPYDSTHFSALAYAMPGYAENVFVDGFVRTLAAGASCTFTEYARECVPEGLSEEGTRQALQRAGIRRYDLDLVAAPDIKAIEDAIRAERQVRGTYRHEQQVATEAEIYAAVRQVRRKEAESRQASDLPHGAYFVSHSPVLNKISTGEEVVTWTPEAVLRYVSTLPGETLDHDDLQVCMMEEYYYAGVRLFDREAYQKVFGSTVSQARIQFQEQLRRYRKDLEDDAQQTYAEAFEKAPDEDKPFLVLQTAWKIAREAEARAVQEGNRQAPASLGRG